MCCNWNNDHCYHHIIPQQGKENLTLLPILAVIEKENKAWQKNKGRARSRGTINANFSSIFVCIAGNARPLATYEIDATIKSTSYSSSVQQWFCICSCP